MLSQYKEVQCFTQKWVWLFIFILTVIPIYYVYEILLKGKLFIDYSAIDLIVVIISLIMIIFIILFSRIKLVTIIDDDEIRIIFKPYIIKVIKWADIEDVKIVDYGFVPGIVIKHSYDLGTIYTTGSRIGLALKTKHGEKLVIGTKKIHTIKSLLTKRKKSLG